MDGLMENCPIDAALRTLSGKWRLRVLFQLAAGPKRFNALQRSTAPITQRVLTATQRTLTDEGLVWRRSEDTVPPHVTYGLTPKGMALVPVFEALARWQTGDSAAISSELSRLGKSDQQKIDAVQIGKLS